MKLKLVRGFAADLTPADKRGRVVCRVGEVTVRLPRDLSSAAKAGDEVLVGGEMRNDVLHAVALKNFTHMKLSKVDFTFHILGAGLGVYLATFGLFFSGQVTTITLFSVEALALALGVVGAVIVFVALQRVLRINKLTQWVDLVNE